MQFEYVLAAKEARAAIPVPALSMEAMRLRSTEAHARERMRKLVVCGALVLCALGAGVAAKMYDGIDFWLSGGKGSVAVRSLVVLMNARPDELKQIAADSTFPVVYPVGLPSGTRIFSVLYSPADHPTSITIQYGYGSAFHGGFSLIDPTQVHAGSQPGVKSFAQHHWRVGGEIVVIPERGISRFELARVQAAMAVTSPSESADVEAAMLPRVLTDTLDVNLPIARAETLAPNAGTSALLDSRAVQSVARLSNERGRLEGRHITTLANIPNVDGVPQYERATMTFRPMVLVSSAGVRGIDAVLSAASVNRADCQCEVLFNQPNRSTYWVWVIPLADSQPIRKYVVDAATLAVRKGG